MKLANIMIVSMIALVGCAGPSPTPDPLNVKLDRLDYNVTDLEDRSDYTYTVTPRPIVIPAEPKFKIGDAVVTKTGDVHKLVVTKIINNKEVVFAENDDSVYEYGTKIRQAPFSYRVRGNVLTLTYSEALLELYEEPATVESKTITFNFDGNPWAPAAYDGPNFNPEANDKGE